MPDIDDLIEQRLRALETGTPLETALDGLSGEDSELVRLAATLRSLPHPEPIAEQRSYQKNRVISAARQIARPVHQPRSLEWGWLRGAIVPVAVIASLLLCAVFTLVGGGLWLSASRNNQAVVIEDVSGQVEAASSGTTAGWHTVANGERIASGTHIRTHDQASAVLVYPSGSKTLVGPGSDLTLVSVERERGNVLQVLLSQSSGKTSHTVRPFTSQKSSFVVQTPSGSASVRGTAFTVSVGPDGWSRWAADSGVVAVNNARSQVILSAGQATATRPGLAPEQPAYQFAIAGELSSGKAGKWAISGVSFMLADPALSQVSLQTGQVMFVEGRIQPDGSLVADSLELASGKESNSFTGPFFVSEGKGDWKIEGVAVQVDKDTVMEDNLSIGQPVRVIFKVREKGLWQAMSLQALTEPLEVVPTPTATPDPQADPSLSFEPDELEVAGCGNDFSLTGTLLNEGDSPEDYAANVLLGYTTIKGGEFVDWVELDPPGWETIPAGEQVNFNIHVTLNSDWNAAPDESEVKIRIYIAQETNRPDHHRTRLTVTIVSSCHRTPSPTPTPTSTGTITPPVTATPTPTPTVTSTGGVTDCTGANPHPTGLKLAARYGVPYEEIMGWFCQHFGFGEIDQAYGLSRQYNKPVIEIFDMRKSGMGWGQIKKALQDTYGALTPYPTKRHGKPD